MNHLGDHKASFPFHLNNLMMKFLSKKKLDFYEQLEINLELSKQRNLNIVIFNVY